MRIDVRSEPMAIRLLDAATEEVRQELVEDTWNETFRRNDQDLVEAIRGNASVRCTLAQARGYLRTILAATESARLGRTVGIP
jgi:predicted dehydrogenase